MISLHGNGETGVGEDVTYDAEEQEQLTARGPVHDLAGSHTIDSFSRAPGLARPLPRRRAGARRVAQLPPLGLRERRARPRAPPGREAARRRARPRGRAGHVRLLDPHRRAARPRPRPAPAGDVPGHALQARPHEGLGRAARRAARRARRRRHRRPEGRLPRHGRGQPGRSGALPARRRGLPATHGSRTPTCDARRRRGARAAPRPGHVGRDRSTRSTTSRGSRSRPAG